MRSFRGIFLTLVMGCLMLRGQEADPPNVLLMKLQADPDNVQARTELMNAYLDAGDKPAYLQQVLWLIQNRPESPILGGVVSLDAADYPAAKAAWEVQLSKQSDSPVALYNAARMMERRDALRSVDLLDQARKVASHSATTHNYAQAEGWIYAQSVARNSDGRPMFPINLQQADALRAHLLASSDPELLSVSGQLMVARIPDPESKKLGMQLMERAVSLDPENPKWQKNLEAAKNPPAQKGLQGAVRIGGAVAEANLIQKVDPVYPPLARSAGISGTVEFTTTIGEEGTVQNLQLVRGHPLLVNAAKEAVLQWKYRPVMLNGRPVKVITDVIVNFILTR